MSWETEEQMAGPDGRAVSPAPASTDERRDEAKDHERPLSYADLRRFLLLISGVALFALLVGALGKVLLLFAVVFFIAAVLNTPVSWMVRRGVKRGLAVVLVMLVAVGVTAGVIAMVVPTILEQTDQLARKAPEYSVRIQSQLENLSQRYPAIDRIIPESRDLAGRLGTQAQPIAGWLLTHTFGVLGGLFLGLIAILLTVFVLLNPQPLVVGLLSATPPRHREAARRSLERFLQQMGAWARATLMMGAITGISTGILLHFIGVQPALLFGTLSFFGELVPNIGPVVAALPALFVAAGESPSTLVWAVVAILFVQQVESNVLVPYIMGTQMELHPVSIVFFALAMGSLFGVAGAILAVPAAATVKIIYDEFYLRPQRVPQDEIAVQAAELIGDSNASGDLTGEAGK
jgi:predicted PurR-regulated permease PerM